MRPTPVLYNLSSTTMVPSPPSLRTSSISSSSPAPSEDTSYSAHSSTTNLSISDLSHQMGAYTLSPESQSPFSPTISEDDCDCPIDCANPSFSFAAWNGFSNTAAKSVTAQTDEFPCSLTRINSFDPSPTDSTFSFSTPTFCPQPSAPILPSWAASDDSAAWAYSPSTQSLPSSYTASSRTVRRQRQGLVRRQCSSPTHIKEIRELVARMVHSGAQCCVDPGTESALVVWCDEPEEMDAKSGMDCDECDLEATRDPLRRFSTASSSSSSASCRPLSATSRASSSGGGVSKHERLRQGVSGSIADRRRVVSAGISRRR